MRILIIAKILKISIKGVMDMASKDERKKDSEYQSWLNQTDKKDTKLNNEWYHTPEKERSDFIKEHKSWWNKF